MIETQQYGVQLKKQGFDFYSGVPCSFLKYLINYAINDCEYVMAANEGDAVAIASGAHLGGKKSVVLMQNSGLTNATSPLTSLNYTFELPILGYVSLRGEPGIHDEPQHQLMGHITGDMLSLMNIKWDYLSDNTNAAIEQIQIAEAHIQEGQSFFFIVKKGTFGEVALNDQSMTNPHNHTCEKSTRQAERPSRRQALKCIAQVVQSNAILLATTGKTGRELFEIEDKPNQLYMVGSMGCIGSLGLGLSLARPDKKVIVIDGDGSAIMRLGSFATNAYYQPANMLHILLDNNTHDSTGGQATVSHIIDFALHSAAMSYPVAKQLSGLSELEAEIKAWLNSGELTLLHLPIGKGSTKNLGRPTLKPHQIKSRLMEYLGQ